MEPWGAVLHDHQRYPALCSRLSQCLSVADALNVASREQGKSTLPQEADFNPRSFLSMLVIFALPSTERAVHVFARFVAALLRAIKTIECHDRWSKQPVS